jgi:hypothetical protein
MLLVLHPHRDRRVASAEVADIAPCRDTAALWLVAIRR